MVMSATELTCHGVLSRKTLHSAESLRGQPAERSQLDLGDYVLMRPYNAGAGDGIKHFSTLNTTRTAVIAE